LVANELIRVAVLWKEKWCKGIEEAFRCYFTNKNPDGMVQVIYSFFSLFHFFLLSLSLSVDVCVFVG
jgi:Ni,Fe-hydrogenase I cytochrome b subunit